MDVFYRYANLAKNCGYGFNLPKGAAFNYLKLRAGFSNDKIGALGKTYPTLVSLVTTKRCNLKCPFCAFGISPSNWQESELTADKLENLLNHDLLKKAIGIVFSGGEPLLNKDLPELITKARLHKKLISLISNGLLFEDKLARDLNKLGVYDCQISVYDWTKDKLANIMPIVSKHIPIFASYVLTKTKLINSAKNNFEDLMDIIRICCDSRCQSLKFSLCTSYPSFPLDLQSSSETITENDKDVYLDFLNICKSKLTDIVFKGYKASLLLPSKKFSCLLPAPVVLNPTKRECRIAWNLYLDANGNYVICCRLMPELNHALCPNIFNDVENVVNSKRAVNIRQCLKTLKNPLAKECVLCAYMNSYSQV